MRNLVFVPTGAASTYYHGFKRICPGRRRMPQMGHFVTKSGRLSLRIYWSHPPTGADVLALGKQGWRVRLALLFDAAPGHHRSFRYHHLEPSPISESLSPAVENFSGHRRNAPAARRTTRHHRGGRHGRARTARLRVTKSETHTRISASVSEGQFRCLVFVGNVSKWRLFIGLPFIPWPLLLERRSLRKARDEAVAIRHLHLR
jgi:hypothetical protein